MVQAVVPALPTISRLVLLRVRLLSDPKSALSQNRGLLAASPAQFGRGKPGVQLELPGSRQVEE